MDRKDLLDLNRLKAIDRESKGGAGLNKESELLTDLYRGQANNHVLSELQRRGAGDERVHRPVQTRLLNRMIREQAVTWRNNPLRALAGSAELLYPDDDPEAVAFARLYRDAAVNSSLRQADRWRCLLGQCAIYVSPRDHATPGIRPYQPHLMMRDPSPSAADDMGSDRAVAFMVGYGSEAKERIWHLWIKDDEGTDGLWEAYRINEAGEIDTRRALYPDTEGKSGLQDPPFFMLYDEGPEGRPWIPIDQTRASYQIAHTVTVNEILYLLSQEAHTPLAISGLQNKKAAPNRWGPGDVWVFDDPETRVEAFQLSPKLLESVTVDRHILEVWATGEGFPADHFLSTRVYESGARGKLRLQNLEDRRADQLESAYLTEHTLFRVLREESEAWGQEAVLHVELQKPEFPVDTAELQKSAAFDLKLGAMSLIDYLQDRFRCSREDALLRWARIRQDREAYPIEGEVTLTEHDSGAITESTGGRPPKAEGDPEASDTPAPEASATPRPPRRKGAR